MGVGIEDLWKDGGRFIACWGLDVRGGGSQAIGRGLCLFRLARALVCCPA
jgi:hypothetical protein